MKKKRAFSFRREPRGDVYRTLIDLGAQRCPTVLLVVRDLRALGPDGRQALETLASFLIDAQHATKWPGTVLYGHEAVAYKYRTSSELSNALKHLATGLYSWQHPNLPEDLSFLRSDGAPWLASIAHQGDAYLELTQEEMLELLNLEPRRVH